MSNLGEGKGVGYKRFDKRYIPTIAKVPKMALGRRVANSFSPKILTVGIAKKVYRGNL